MDRGTPQNAGTFELRREELEERLQAIRQGSLRALSMLLELKDAGRRLHTSRLTPWAVEVASRLGLAGGELEDVRIAYALHDLGKIGVPDALLLRPGRLTEGEMNEIRRHPEFGWTILHPIPGLQKVGLLVLHQNEWFDGGGEPGGLAGEEIPLGSRIVAAVDAFEAFVTDRPYRPGQPPRKAIPVLRRMAGFRLDPRVVETLIEVTGENLVELPRILRRPISDRPPTYPR